MKKFNNDNNNMIIIILGPPGSGKGTQAELLRKKFKLEYIGSGDLLRNRAKKNDYTGRKVKEEINKGKRISTPIIFDLWMDKLEQFKKNPKSKGLILDGSPRTIFEAEMLEQAFNWYGWLKNKKVIFVDVSPREVIYRLTKRRICKKCGKIIPYVGEFKKLQRCDKCGGNLVRRADDDLKDIKERLRWFKAEVVPAINYYKKKRELIRINGEQSIEKVYQDILKVIRLK